MSADQPNMSAQDASLEEWIDRIADRFEAVWQAGDRPKIEDYLSDAPNSRRLRLLCELVELDVQYRSEAGETVELADYNQRFPELESNWFKKIIAAVETATPSDADLFDPSDRIASRQPKPAAPKTIRCPHCGNPIRLVEQRLEEVLCTGCGSSISVRDSQLTDTLQFSRQVDKFQFLELVGRGAFGEVWRAKDTQLDRIVAVKVPHGGLLGSKTELERFQREARIAAQLKHAGIITIHEIAKLNGIPAIVSEFVEGAPLQDLLEVRELSFRETAELVAEVAEALDYAHSTGAVHRDVKPSNIMIERPASDVVSKPVNKPEIVGKPKIMDFGLAMHNQAEITMTVDGQILGTPAYMSPEQASGQGHRADGRSDIYSLGAVLYQMLTGELPFRGSRLMLVNQVLHEEPRAPRKLNHKVPRDLETICLKAMNKSPNGRYPSAHEMADDLRRWLRGEAILARPVTPIELFARWCRRNPRVASLSAAVILLLLTVAATLLVSNVRIGRQKAQAERQRQVAVESLVHALAIAQPQAAPKIVDKVKRLGAVAQPYLRKLFEGKAAEMTPRLRAAYALSALGEVKADFLMEAIALSSAAECRNIAAALAPVKKTVSETLYQRTLAEKKPDAKIRLTSVLIALGDYRGAQAILSLDADRSMRTKFIHTFEAWWWDWSALPALLRETKDAGCRSGVCSALSLLDPNSLAEKHRAALQEVLLDLYTSAADPGTHSAAQAALRRWDLKPPPLKTASRPQAGQRWYVNRSGLTMLRVPDGEYSPATPLVPGFFMSDGEVSIELFHEFISDRSHPSVDKPKNWQAWRPQVSEADRRSGLWGPNAEQAPDPLCPVHNVNIYDAMLFCNWLSLQEGRRPCYTKSDKKWIIGNLDNDRRVQMDGWRCEFDSDGYRLPTLWEWRYAGAAGAFPFFGGELSNAASLLKMHVDITGSLPSSFQGEAVLLQKYAWFDVNSKQRTWPSGRLLPSPWGLFDMFGNVNEYCWHIHVESRVMGWFSLAGGDWTQKESFCSLSTLYYTAPTARNRKNGFRVVCKDPSADAAFRRGLIERQTRVQQEPDNKNYINGLSGTYQDQGDRARDAGDFQQALRWYDQAIDALQTLVSKKANYFGVGQHLHDPYAKRAILLEQLGQPDKALEDWRIVLDVEREKSAPTMQRIALLAAQAAKDGEHIRAEQAAQQLLRASRKHPTILYNIACVFSLCAAAVNSEESVLKQKYAGAAAEVLRNAIAAGFADLDLIQKDSDLDAIRNREDFKQTMETLRKKQKR